MRILVAEDDETVCRQIRERLDVIRFSVLEFMCVPSLHKLNNEVLHFNPSIILLDLSFKKTNGEPATAPEDAIGCIPPLVRFAPVAIISGDDPARETSHYVSCMAAGASFYIFKPVFLVQGCEIFLGLIIKQIRDKWLHDNGRGREIKA